MEIQGRGRPVRMVKTTNEVKLQADSIFSFLGIGALLTGSSGIQVIHDILPFEEGHTFADVFGLIFVCIWISVLGWMCVYSFTYANRMLMIGNEGVLCKNWFRKRRMTWAEIRDWGIILYCGKTRGAGNTYYFYFSGAVHPVKHPCMKRLK